MKTSHALIQINYQNRKKAKNNILYHLLEVDLKGGLRPLVRHVRLQIKSPVKPETHKENYRI
jgi:hypothetical protein